MDPVAEALPITAMSTDEHAAARLVAVFLQYYAVLGTVEYQTRELAGFSGKFRKTHERGTYCFLNKLCIGAECWSPGSYQHRGATLSGSRNTGAETKCCMRRAYHGCPDTIGYSELRAKARKAEGWKKA